MWVYTPQLGWDKMCFFEPSYLFPFWSLELRFACILSFSFWSFRRVVAFYCFYFVLYLWILQVALSFNFFVFFQKSPPPWFSVIPTYAHFYPGMFVQDSYGKIFKIRSKTLLWLFNPFRIELIVLLSFCGHSCGYASPTACVPLCLDFVSFVAV